MVNTLKAAGDKTVVFILYMIPTRDYDSNASAGGTDSLIIYKGDVNNIIILLEPFALIQIQRLVIMILEPDTCGNLVTGNGTNC